ncbi:kinase-like domain-containing protein [Phaeosphaeriaceae sp. PMI808]|nr:kinase-like domain-containing protein [Phaeosphaeriaceae sp. PMI808]
MAVDGTERHSSTCPDIRSKRDLTTLSEAEEYGTGKFLRSIFTYIDKDNTVWFGEVPRIRKYDLTVEILKRELRRIPNEKIYPLHNKMISYMLKLLPRILLEEAEILEFLNQHRHPNIIRYYGCTVKHGYITGLALEKYDVMLQNRRNVDVAVCMDGIRAGVEHLHSLGLAHNDLNPTNIALDAKDNPIILDFGSCKKFGEELISAGTPSWVDEDYTTSAQQHDIIAMGKIEAWLREEN